MKDNTDAVFEQSAAIPYRVHDSETYILLIRNRSNKRWIVPKGIIEEWQTPEEAAADEAYEEAGVRGAIIGGAVGSFEYRKWGGTCRVKVYLLRVEREVADWPEAAFRRRRWVGVEEALEMVENGDIRRLIRLASDRIGEGEKWKERG